MSTAAFYQQRGHLTAAFILTLSAMPIAATLRYRWPDFVFVFALVLCLAILATRPGLGTAVPETLRRWLKNPVGTVCLLVLGWFAASLLWSPDPRLSALEGGKALGIITAALLFAALLRCIPAQRIFPVVIGCTVVATIVAMFTAITGGVVHQAFGCCRHGMQPEYTGAAVTIALFVWPCLGWLVLRGRIRVAILLWALVFCLILVSRSGAAGLALAAGTITAVIGYFSVRAGVAAVAILAALMLISAPTLAELDAVLGRIGALEYLTRFHAQERIRIWEFYGDLFWQRPFTGFGIGAERALLVSGLRTSLNELTPPHFSSLHPHNTALQILFNFGLVGAGLVFAAVVILCVRALAALKPDSPSSLAFAIAPLAAFLAAASVNFGMWESWWSAVVSVTLVFSARLAQAAAGSPADDTEALIGSVETAAAPRPGFMKAIPPVLLLALLAGCASSHSPSVLAVGVPGKFDGLTCKQLVPAIQGNATDIKRIEEAMRKAGDSAAGAAINFTTHSPRLAQLQADRTFLADAYAEKKCETEAPLPPPPGR